MALCYDGHGSARRHRDLNGGGERFEFPRGSRPPGTPGGCVTELLQGLKTPLVEKGPVTRRATPTANGIGVAAPVKARPPDPVLIGESWRSQWLERLRGLPFFPALWLAHQRRDAYRRHGSVCENFSAIACPVFAVGGWADAYTNAIPRLLAGLTVPRLGLIGPWAHVYPQDGKPGPAIGFLQEALRWWDHSLKGADAGVMNAPMLRAFIEDGGALENREHA